MEKIFVRYPGLRSSTRRSDPCVRSEQYLKCPKCMVSITSDRFLGDEQQRKFTGSTRKHPYVIIADTLGCNLRCWFCYSHQFWTLERAAKARCSPTFLSAEELVSQITCKIEKLSDHKGQMERKPFMRIRFSGGEPIFATPENLAPFSGSGAVSYEQGIDFWLGVFKALDPAIGKLRKDRKIVLINEDEWSGQQDWPIFITDSAGRVNVRFDTNGIAFGIDNEASRVGAGEGLVKERAGYRCEICGVEPFMQRSGIPFAEAHHVFELAEMRIDNPNHMICVCPTCHKVIHYGDDESLAKRSKVFGKLMLS